MSRALNDERKELGSQKGKGEVHGEFPGRGNGRSRCPDVGSRMSLVVYLLQGQSQFWIIYFPEVDKDHPVV